jgi:hypothetical protein
LKQEKETSAFLSLPGEPASVSEKVKIVAIDGTNDQLYNDGSKLLSQKEESSFHCDGPSYPRGVFHQRNDTQADVVTVDETEENIKMLTTQSNFQTRAARQSKQNRLKILQRQGLSFFLRWFGDVKKTSLTFFCFFI